MHGVRAYKMIFADLDRRLTQRFIFKNKCFKHTCNDDDDIGRRKQQKLDCHNYVHMLISYLIHHNVSDENMDESMVSPFF